MKKYSVMLCVSVDADDKNSVELLANDLKNLIEEQGSVEEVYSVDINEIKYN